MSFIAKPQLLLWIALFAWFTGNFAVVLLIYFGSTQVVEMLTGEYIEFSAFGCGVFALSLIFASYASQTLRGAIQAIQKGSGIRCRFRIKPTLYFHSFDYAASMATRFTGLKQSMARVIKRDTALVSWWC